MKLQLMGMLFMSALIVLVTDLSQAATLFSDNFENDLSQWTGQNYDSHHAVIVPDPIRPGNQVVSFNGTTLGGDIFSVPAVTLVEGQQYSFSIEYLGKAVYNSVPDNYGGFAGLCDIVPADPYYPLLSGNCWIFGTPVDYQYLRQHLIDDGQWRRYTYNFVWNYSEIHSDLDTIHVMLEDFVYPGNSVVDVFFDNVRLIAIPVLSTWRGPGSGSYNLASNWTNNTVPDGVDAIANFFDSVTTISVVTLNTDVTIGTMNFDSAKPYTITGTPSLTLQTSIGDASIDVESGHHRINVPVFLGSDTIISGAGILNLNGGISGDHTLIIESTVYAKSIQVDTLIIGNVGVQAVPEPNSFLMTAVLVLGGSMYLWRRHRETA